MKTNWIFTNTYDNVLFPIPPSYSGCYAFYRLNWFTGVQRLLYIGTAENLSNRLNNHKLLSSLYADRTIPEEIVIVKIKIISDAKERLQTEKRLIQRLNPPLNKIKFAYNA